MGGRGALQEVLEAIAALDPLRLREHAGPNLTVFAPFGDVAPPGRSGTERGDALEVALARVDAWAGGPLQLTACVVDGAWALGEYARPADGAPLTAVVRGAGDGSLEDLRLYLDVGAEART